MAKKTCPSPVLEGHSEKRRRKFMTLLDLIILLIVAGICGALGQAITGYSRGGCLVAIALGFIGALIGMWVARAMGLPELFAVDVGGTRFPIIWSIIGSALFVAVVSLIARGRV
jgi:uncharacterized membrane protein YeaQ/YmgE (transglycosylase-associated protein family)